MSKELKGFKLDGYIIVARKYPNYPSEDVVRVSLKRPYARKYCQNGFFDEKSISAIMI